MRRSLGARIRSPELQLNLPRGSSRAASGDWRRVEGETGVERRGTKGIPGYIRAWVILPNIGMPDRRKASNLIAHN